MNTTATHSTQTTSLSENARAELKRRREESLRRFPYFEKVMAMCKLGEDPPDEMWSDQYRKEREAHSAWLGTLPPLPA